MMNEIEYVREFTKVYKENSEDIYNREVECHFLMHKENRTQITKDDYFLSCFPNPICGFGSRSSSFMYYCKLNRLEALKEDADYETKKELDDLYRFWADENDKERLRRYYPSDIKSLMPIDEFETEFYTSYPLYRLGGPYLNFQKLLDLGIDGLISEIEDKEDYQSNAFLISSKKSLDYLKKLIEFYRDDAKEINPELSKTLNELLLHKPYTMKEAIQLIWIYVGVSDVRNYGRMDDLLARYLEHNANDYKNIYEYFKVIQKRNTIYNGRIIIGGMGRKNPDSGNQLAKIAMQVMKDHHFTEPQLTLRWSLDMDESIYDLAIDCIKEGCSYPLLYNDEVNVRNVQKSMNVSFEEAQDYVPFGCGEYVINHKSVGSPNGIINMTKVLEGIINQGKCILSDKEITRYFINVDNITSFDDVYDVFKSELEYQIDILAKQESFEYHYMNKRCGFLFNSILYDNCIEKGKSLLNGGVQYKSGTLETYGNINAGDSLFAIKKLVFDTKEITLKDMIEAIKNNFVGYEDFRKKCLHVSKYGNDENEVNQFINDLNQFVALTTQKMAIKYNMASYLIVIINNEANSKLGFKTAASCDGRLAREPLANALTPQSGAEKSGITAVLNTVSNMDVSHMAGAVYNLKLSKDMVNNHLDTVKILIKTYFKHGGSQIMINVLNQEELKDAMIHPEKYPNLIVRVGGFSARFIDLSPIVQREIVSRMVY